MTTPKRDSGSALLLAVVILAVFSAGAGAAWQAMHIQLKQTRDARLSEIAYQLAEAGLEHAIAELRQDRTWRGTAPTPLGEGSYEVSVQVSPAETGFYLLKSTGRIGNELVEYQRVTLAAELRLGENGDVLGYRFSRVPKQVKGDMDPTPGLPTEPTSDNSGPAEEART